MAGDIRLTTFLSVCCGTNQWVRFQHRNCAVHHGCCEFRSDTEVIQLLLQKEKLGNWMAFLTCQRMSTDRNRARAIVLFEGVACPSKLASPFFWYVSWLIFPLFLEKQGTCTLTNVRFGILENFRRVIYEIISLCCRWAFPSCCLLVANSSCFTLRMLAAGSPVLLTSPSPAAPPSNWASGSAAAWPTRFLPHLLPSGCWTMFPWVQDQLSPVTACPGCCRSSVFSDLGLEMQNHTSSELQELNFLSFAGGRNGHAGCCEEVQLNDSAQRSWCWARVGVGTLTVCCREGKQVHGYLTCPELLLQTPNPATCWVISAAWCFAPEELCAQLLAR